MRYIPDLFSDMRRLAFEARIGFFCNKAIALQERIASGLNVVLDRTLYEDDAVFANYFVTVQVPSWAEGDFRGAKGLTGPRPRAG